MLLITIIGNVFPLMWVEFWRFFGSVLEKAWKGPPWVLEVNSSCACSRMLQCPETQADRTETGNGAWKVSGTQGRGRPMNYFIYLFIYLFIVFWAPSLSLQQLPVFVAADLPLGPLQQPHIFIAVPVLENLINERTWLVTHMTYLVLKKSFICLL